MQKYYFTSYQGLSYASEVGTKFTVTRGIRPKTRKIEGKKNLNSWMGNFVFLWNSSFIISIKKVATCSSAFLLLNLWVPVSLPWSGGPRMNLVHRSCASFYDLWEIYSVLSGLSLDHSKISLVLSFCGFIILYLDMNLFLSIIPKPENLFSSGKLSANISLNLASQSFFLPQVLLGIY